MEKRPKFLIIFILVLIGFLVLFWLIQSKGYVKSNIPHVPSFKPSPSPKSSVTTVQSPDGKMTLTMKAVPSKEDLRPAGRQDDKRGQEVTYHFLLSNQIDNSQKELFTKTVPDGVTLSIPFNTFAPNGKFVLLKEVDGDQTTYFALSTSGVPVNGDSQTVDISTLFGAKYSNYKITDMTGWGGTNLIVINTDKNDGGIGPSFWFDVGSKSFIQLSTRFN